MKRRSLKIIKIPGAKSPNYKQEFIPQAINYLKIIENKDKIKYDQLTKDFDPKNDLKSLVGRKLDYPNPEPYVYQPPQLQQQLSHNSQYTENQPPILKSDVSKYSFDIPLDSDDEDYIPQPKIYTPPLVPTQPTSKPSYTPPLGPTQPIPKPSYTPPKSQIITHSEQYSTHTPELPQPSPPPQPSAQIERQFGQSLSYNNTHTPQSIKYTPPRPPTQPISPQYNFYPSSKNSTPTIRTPNKENHDYKYNYELHTPTHSHKSTPTNDIHSKLHDFLNTSDTESIDGDYEHRRQRKFIDPYKYMSEKQRKFNMMDTGPPTLDELVKNGEYKPSTEYLDVHQIDDMLNHQKLDSRQHSRENSRQHSVSRQLSIHENIQHPIENEIRKDILDDDDESIDDKKRELLYKLDMLRKKYPDHSNSIPQLNMQTPFKELKNIYQTELRKLEVDDNVSNYRTYLIGGFMITEFVLGRYLRLDLEGFTQQQIMSMKQYERFLIEIGEKNYVPDGKKWPVEVRLIGFILIQAAVFTVSKMLLKKTGTSLLNMFNSAIPNNNNNNQPKRKMKMPDVDLED